LNEIIAGDVKARSGNHGQGGTRKNHLVELPRNMVLKRILFCRILGGKLLAQYRSFDMGQARIMSKME
jgi:hypothetical protein